MDLSRYFTSSDDTLFLNAGTLSRSPLRALDAMERHRREAERNPTRAFFQSYPKLWATQQRIALHLGATPADLFFRANITQALNDFLFAVPLPKDGEVLATEWEYGATAEIARERARQSGLSYREARFTPDEFAADALIGELRGDTRLLVFSHVVTGTGLVLPVEKIAQAAAAKGIVVVVDGAHAPGSVDFRLDDFPSVDFYGGNLHKWFLGPRGTAFGWVHRKWNGLIPWKFSGWANRETPAFYQNFGGGDRETARRFPSGTFDVFPFYALNEVMDFWDEHGPAKIRARQYELRDRCAERAEALGWQRVSPRSPGSLGPLVSYQLPAGWDGSVPTALATRIFQETQVQLAIPKAGGRTLLRFSPGCYGTEAEIDLAFERLAKFRGQA